MATLTKKDKTELAAAAATVTRLSAKAAAPTKKKCRKAPAGWKCSRNAGHDGPCAAKQVPAKAKGAKK